MAEANVTPISAARTSRTHALKEAADRIAHKAFSGAFNELCEAADPQATLDETIAAYLRTMREQLEAREQVAATI
jgi:hypothetical protein